MILILIRHAETNENRKGLFAGHLDARLSVQGINQAKKLGKRFKHEKIDFIYSSDLKRASHTAKEVSKYHSRVAVILTRGIRERYLGELEGKSTEIAGQKLNILTADPVSGESLDDLVARAEKFLLQLLKKHPHETVLAVSHGGFNRALVAAIKQLPADELKKMPKPHNAGVSIFEISQDRRHKIHVYDSIEHLEKI